MLVVRPSQHAAPQTVGRSGVGRVISSPAQRLAEWLPPDACRDAAIRIEDLKRRKQAGRVLVVEVDEHGQVHATVERRYALAREARG